MPDIRNILFITTDQQRQDSLPCYGLDFVESPNIDALARDGIVFDSCISVSPVCQPARGAFMSGQYPFVNGVPDNFRWLRPGTPTIAEAFREAGRQTAAIGKMHFHPWDNPEGFEYRIIAEDKRHIFRPDHWTRYLEENGLRRDHPAEVPGYAANMGAFVSPLPEEHQIDSFIGREAVRWIEGLDDRPFFGWISFNNPHDPYDPPADFADRYLDAPIPEPVGSAEELAEKPAYQREISPVFRDNLLYLTDYSRMTPETIRRMRAYYYAQVTMIDRRIGEILDALERRGLRDSTLIVFSSDHGDHLGDHGLPFKSTFYESSLKVPLIIAGPGVAGGRRCGSFIDWLDLHVLFRKLAGIPVPDFVQGRDVSPLLADPSLPLRQDAFSELLGAAMVTTAGHKLVLCDDGDGELYDLREKPLEVRNHFRDPEYRDVRQDLESRLVRHLLGHSRVRRFGGGPPSGRSAAGCGVRRDPAEGGAEGVCGPGGHPGRRLRTLRENRANRMKSGRTEES